MLGQQLIQTLFAESGGAGGVHQGNKVVVGIVAGDLEARVGEDGGKRQADMAGSHDTDLQGTIAHYQLLVLSECSTKRRALGLKVDIQRTPPPSSACSSEARRSTMVRSMASCGVGPRGVAMRISIESARRANTMSRISAMRKSYSLPYTWGPV